MIGAARRIADLAQIGYNTPEEAIKAFDELEEDWEFELMDSSVERTEEEEDKIDRTLAEIRRAREVIEQNQNNDLYSQKNFSDWLKARNARIRKERQVEINTRNYKSRQQDTEQLKTVYEQLDIKSPTEREKSRERAAELVLQDGGIRIHMSVEGSLSVEGNSGFQNLEARLQDYRNPSTGAMEAQFLDPSESSSGMRLDEALKQHGIKEIIDISHDTKPVYETITIPGKKGVLGIGKTADRTTRKPTGRYEQVLHSEHVSGGKDEPAVRFNYYIPQSEWRDYSGREGQMMIAEIVLPESVAKEVEQIVERDPAAMRKIVERVMKEKLLKDPKTWETPQGAGDSLRPPYDKWDAESGGGKIYLQKESMTPGFHEEALRKIQK